MATRWVKEATEGDHTRLAFDRPGTWSQKYNLVWDKILASTIFRRKSPEERPLSIANSSTVWAASG
jgi:hypothetical protein